MSLMALKSCTNRYSSECGFLTGKIGVLYGDWQGLISPRCKNLCETGWIPFKTSFFRGYFSILDKRLLFFFFLKILFFPFSPQSPLVHSCIFFIVDPSSCGMWDAASAWFDEQCHVRTQDSNQRNTGPPAAECANLTTWPWGQPQEAPFLSSIFIGLADRARLGTPSAQTAGLTRLWLSGGIGCSPSSVLSRRACSLSAFSSGTVGEAASSCVKKLSEHSVYRANLVRGEEWDNLLLGQAARNMVLQEDAILHSEDSLRKMAIITTHLQYQQEAIQKNVEQSSDLQDQLNHLLK
uniref:BLOC-1-related complex subunit 7 n=1 Tax=Equus caballus TaxID=9796 RepID=A0A9L0TTH3_HORSE